MKAITFNDLTKVFHLRTRNSSYQMQIGDYNVLKHLYYGASVGNTEITDRFIHTDCGFSGNIFEAGRDRTFSLDTIPQEYTADGNGDYRINGLQVEHKDGSDIADLRYESHQIVPGKYSIEGLPAMYGTEEEAESLIITLCDQASQVRIKLYFGVFPEFDVITRAVQLENKGENPVTVRRIMSVELDMENKQMDWIHFHGRHTMERQMERAALQHGVQSIGSLRGTSSHQHNPFMILCDRDANETQGDCYGFAFVYSGNFLCEVEKDQLNQIRTVMGIHPYHFAYQLKQGQSFAAPEVIMTYSEHGFGELSHKYHDAMRKNLIRSKYVEKPRPILVNNWEATYFDFDEEKLFEIAAEAKEMGLDLFVLDDGWFGKRDTDYTGLGDWYVNENKIKGGLEKLVKKINDCGIKFGLWIEPEMISEDSDLYREHPDWCLKVPGRNVTRGRYQLNLDVSRKEVREHIMNQIFDVIDRCHVEYIKWDMNRSVGNVYSSALPAEQQGEVFHRYVLGVYEMMEQLVQRYPDLLFENCSGGGGRFDAGMLYYSPQIWCSDNTDAIDRLKIQYGTSFCYPISTMGAHVSVCPNHQTGRSTPMETRAVVASAGTFGFELELQKLSEEEKMIAKEKIRRYREIQHLIQSGEYFRLTNPFENQEFAAWQFLSKDKREVLVNGVQLKGESNPRTQIIYLRGLERDAFYKEQTTGRIYTGAALMKAGISLINNHGDYQPIEYSFVRM